MKLSEAIAEYKSDIDGTISHRTVGTYMRALKFFQNSCGDIEIDKIKPRDVRRWRNEMAQQQTRYENHPRSREKEGGLSVFTQRKRLTSVRTFFLWCVRERLIDYSPFDNVRIPPKPHRSKRKVKAITEGDYRAMMKAAGDNPLPDERDGRLYELRDQALIAFLWATNTRAGGVVGLMLDDVRIASDLSEGEATVTEKGEITRTVYFGESAAMRLSAWLDVRPRLDGRHVFITLTGSNRKEFQHKPLTAHSIRKTLYRIGKRANVVGSHNPHSFRHAFGIRATRRNVPLNVTSRLLGHSSIAVTDEFYSVFSHDDMKQLYRGAMGNS